MQVIVVVFEQVPGSVRDGCPSEDDIYENRRT